eukprot:7392647-Heterocapsa_arctica.AAC.1
MVDGDAPVAHGGPTDNGQEVGRVRMAPADVDRPVRPLKAARQHHAGSDGKMSANRSGKELCYGFQDGTCSATGSDGISCAKNSRYAHQCNVCLSAEHGGASPVACARPQPRQPSG